MVDNIDLKDKYREAASNYRHISTGQFTSAGLFILIIVGLFKEWLTCQSRKEALFISVLSWVASGAFLLLAWIWRMKSQKQERCAAQIERQSFATEDEKKEQKCCPFMAMRPERCCFVGWITKANFWLAICVIIASIICYIFSTRVDWPLRPNENNIPIVHPLTNSG